MSYGALLSRTWDVLWKHKTLILLPLPSLMINVGMPSLVIKSRTFNAASSARLMPVSSHNRNKAQSRLPFKPG